MLPFMQASPLGSTQWGLMLSYVFHVRCAVLIADRTNPLTWALSVKNLRKTFNQDWSSAIQFNYTSWTILIRILSLK